MVGETKERILETALELFAQSGYLGTSMSDIAARLGITKAALYKHYAGKQKILDRIVQRMNELDAARAAAYEMPGAAPELTLEQYRDARLAQLYQENLASGPVKYMAAIFRPLTDSDETAMQLALDFYGPMYLLYSVYDGAADQSAVAPMLEAHIDRFIAKLEGEYRKKNE